MVVTEEVARNPNPEIKITCTNCQQSYSIKDSLIERPLTGDYSTVVQGLIVCPNCGIEKHSYYLSQHARHLQTRLANAVTEWQKDNSSKNFRNLIKAKKSYTNKFDADQERYKGLNSNV